MDLDFNAQLDQSQQSDFIKSYRKLVATYAREDRNNGGLPIPDIYGRLARRYYSRRINQLLQNRIKQKFEELRTQSSSSKSRSVLALALQDTQVLTQSLISETCDQLKTFLFAGHDTTSILLQWIFYQLSRTPRALKALTSELDEIFGPDPDPAVVRDKLLVPGQGDDLMRRMVYTSAVIKETLRLYPPAGTARMAPMGSGLVVKLPQNGYSGEKPLANEVCLDGMVVYNCHYIVQRDPTVYGENAEDWVPERWLGDTDTSMRTNVNLPTTEEKAAASTGSGIPPSAWRPFERGPRNCIGQELANIEARVILACAVRRYDFTKVGLGESQLDVNGEPMLNEKGQYQVKSELYNVSSIFPALVLLHTRICWLIRVDPRT
jgi:cytochrome P450